LSSIADAAAGGYWRLLLPFTLAGLRLRFICCRHATPLLLLFRHIFVAFSLFDMPLLTLLMFAPYAMPATSDAIAPDTPPPHIAVFTMLMLPLLTLRHFAA